MRDAPCKSKNLDVPRAFNARRRNVASTRVETTRRHSRLVSTLSAARGSVRPRRRRSRASSFRSPHTHARVLAPARAPRARPFRASPPPDPSRPARPRVAMRAAGRWTRAPRGFLRGVAAPRRGLGGRGSNAQGGWQRAVRARGVARCHRAVRLERSPDASRASTFTNRAAARFALFTRGGASEELMPALRDAERSLEIDPRWVKGHYRAGACLARLRDFAAARDGFRRRRDRSAERTDQIGVAGCSDGFEETPRDWEDAKTRGNAKYRDGKYEDAVRWYTRGVEFDSGNG